MVGATSGASSASAAAMILLQQEQAHHLEAPRSTMDKTHSHNPSADYPPRTASPLSDPEDPFYTHNETTDSSWDDSSDEYDDVEFGPDPRRERPAGPHLVIDTDTMRLPSGRIISSRSGTGASGISHTRRQQRRRSPHLLEEQDDQQQQQPRSGQTAHTTSSRSPTPEHALAPSSTTTTTETLSRREAKRNRAVTTQYQRLRLSDQQTVARLPLGEQCALLATTQRAVEGAQREGQRFTGKMDSLGNIKVSERFVNDVPGGKAHKNRFFAR
ncbi:hypothetical protein Micbo1qcDRAFT_168898 [Microdochium bolleyi]|uniref:Uncharacterized protein n=1 Tax=Microdochium bolleyi TaxID=196109 RepID=A0A136IMP8_9PEZI|nr:hypothetical protein Micbo1qcDRAFT_168898 [Microdochium bolleyi]